MISMRSEKYEKLLATIQSMNYKCGRWFPSVEDIKKYLEPDIEQNIKFAIWIMETGDKPKTEEEKKSRHYLMRLINDHLKITGVN